MRTQNVSLKPYNTFSIDVMARFFTRVDSVHCLQEILSDPSFKTMPHLVLGGGSNLLFTQDFNGLVIHNQIKGIEKINEDAEHVFLKIGAGENWHELVLYCIAHDYAGIENLSLIPGTVGAAPIQNIGAYGVELKDVLHEVHTIDIEKNTPCVFDNAACAFGYRDSVFKNTLKNKHIVTQVVLRLNKTPAFHVEYGAIREKINGATLSIRAISDAVIQIRQEKLPDPNVIPNAGSFFKNPIVSRDTFLLLQAQYPKMPYFSEDNNHIKIPAGWLIEQCGFKGKQFGSVGVHAHQALVLVNNGNGSGHEIKQLSEEIQAAVMRSFHILLTPEVNIY